MVKIACAVLCSHIRPKLKVFIPGHGTVDSGHLCLSGYNEVVMLRRLPKGHDGNALHADEKGYFDMPHALGEKTSDWPTKAEIHRMKSLNYCPIVLILGPGEHLHIGKGRFHAFRKLGAETLPDDDCHSDLRREVHSTLGMDKSGFASLVNFSIAWDWSFLGWTPEGINREMAATLECALRNRKLANPKQSLAIPKLCLISCCKSSIAAIRSEGSGFGITVTSNDGAQQHRNILKGLLPTLEFVVSQEQDAFQASGSVKLQNELHPHSWENPAVFPIDPYGISDYSCKFCHQELANTYMHCNGCEDILKKDFNICAECHFDSKYRVFVIMNDQDFSFDSSLNHTGALSPPKHRNCKAKRCGVCQRGRKCCCTCHHNFSPQQRLWNCKILLEVLKAAKDIVAEDKIPFHGEVSQRLMQALKGN